jgi:hypothetical protein
MLQNNENFAADRKPWLLLALDFFQLATDNNQKATYRIADTLSLSIQNISCYL